LLTENMALALFSGAVGIMVAGLSMEALRAAIPATIPRIDEIRLDTTVLFFGFFITTACGVLCGLAPAMRFGRRGLLSALTQNGKGAVGHAHQRWRHGLVVAQTGLATTLLVLAALLLQSLARLQDVPLGFEPSGVMTARVSTPQVRYPDAAAMLEFQQTLLGSLETLPSIRAVGSMTSAPFAPGVRRGVTVHRRAMKGGASEARAVEQIVSPGVLQALGVRLLAGREFGAQDHRGSPLVAMVSESLARTIWADGHAVGQVLEFDGRSHEVVGVAGDIRGTEGTARGGSLDRPPSPVLYVSSAQVPQRTISLVLRADATLQEILPAIRSTVREIDPTLPVPELRLLDEWIAEGAEQARLTTTLAGAFAGAALLLTVVGIYGVISYSVGQRTQEIGVRMALGAHRVSVLQVVLTAAMTWAVGGIVLGLLGAWSLSRAITSLLFDVSATDPFTFTLTALTLAGVAVLASLIPAVRATRIDPVIALRGD
jgi:predicted permease